MVNERFDKTKLNRRRTYQSVLAFDVFIRQLEITKPAYSSFFTNHMASAMHRYWAATFTEDFDDFALSKDWIKSYSHEIDFAMNKSDHMFERLIDFTKKNKDYEIWLTGSMGQDVHVQHGEKQKGARGLSAVRGTQEADCSYLHYDSFQRAGCIGHNKPAPARNESTCL